MKKNNLKYVFLILHYYTIDDTKKCVDSINTMCDGKNYEIVIVDNASKNNSGVELEKTYKDINNIHVIINSENLGFANGNNVGFKYIKENLTPDFIIMCNNDTWLLQNNFLDLIDKEYSISKFSVLGPKILLPNDEVNKVKLNIPSVKKLKKELINYRLDYVSSYIHVYPFYKKVRKLITKTLILLKLKKDNKKTNDTNIRYENIVLHGSFLIFSKQYIDKFDGLDDRTFLYKEEELLALRLNKNGLISVYNPEIVIFHNEDSSTNAITKSNRKKIMFVSKNMIKSIKILLKELNK